MLLKALDGLFAISYYVRDSRCLIHEQTLSMGEGKSLHQNTLLQKCINGCHASIEALPKQRLDCNVSTRFSFLYPKIIKVAPKLISHVKILSQLTNKDSKRSSQNRRDFALIGRTFIRDPIDGREQLKREEQTRKNKSIQV